MELNKIIAITGKPGLFEILSQTKTRIIVQSLIDGKRFSIGTATHQINLLENTAIYTFEKEAPLSVIFKTIFDKENGNETISHKENTEKLKTYFAEILPDYDHNRVYISNIKKVVQWYNILLKSKFDFTKLQPKEPKKE